MTAPRGSVPRPRAGPTTTRPSGARPLGLPPAVATEPDAEPDLDLEDSETQVETPPADDPIDDASE